jgi:sugar-specific transcriptional regulator TrmB
MRKESLGSFDLEIKLSTSFDLFFSDEDIPEELRAAYQGILQKRNYFHSFEELNDRVREIIANFEETFVEETKKKAILYSINYDDRRGHQIYFNYLVVQRIDTGSRGGKIETRYYTERACRGMTKSSIVLDDVNTFQAFREGEFSEMLWSKEREIWFEQMALSVQNLGKRLLDGFGAKPEVLARKIDLGGISFLLEGKTASLLQEKTEEGNL